MDFETGNPMIGNPNMDPYAASFDKVKKKNDYTQQDIYEEELIMDFETGNPVIGNPSLDPYA
jgi:hypothetical protein